MNGAALTVQDILLNDDATVSVQRADDDTFVVHAQRTWLDCLTETKLLRMGYKSQYIGNMHIRVFPLGLK